ncbi:MAG: hypothetical protein LBM78_00265 [Clostridiales bacterium]|jgi:hypothetical protein|nr:hypothetical protein [Clostridiales bacterium]
MGKGIKKNRLKGCFAALIGVVLLFGILFGVHLFFITPDVNNLDRGFRQHDLIGSILNKGDNAYAVNVIEDQTELAAMSGDLAVGFGEDPAAHVSSMLTASKPATESDIGNYIAMFWFEDIGTTWNAYKNLKSYLKDHADEIFGEDVEVIYGIHGRCVWYGTENAAAAARRMIWVLYVPK